MYHIYYHEIKHFGCSFLSWILNFKNFVPGGGLIHNIIGKLSYLSHGNLYQNSKSFLTVEEMLKT